VETFGVLHNDLFQVTTEYEPGTEMCDLRAATPNDRARRKQLTAV